MTILIPLQLNQHAKPSRKHGEMTTKKNRTAKSQPFKSRYYGECAICNEFFDPGEAVVRLLTGYYRTEERESVRGTGSYQHRVNRDYAHAGCAVQPPPKPIWLPDHYRWCTVCDDWWDMVEHRGVCKHAQPWYEDERRKRWEELWITG